MLKIGKTNLLALVVFFSFIHQLALAQNSPHDVTPQKIVLNSREFNFKLDFSNAETGRNVDFAFNIGGCRLNFWSNVNNLIWVEEIGERTPHGQPYFDAFYFNSILDGRVDESSVNVAAKNDKFTNYQRRNLCKVQLDDKSKPGKFILEASLSGTYIFSNFKAFIEGQEITKHIIPSTTAQSTPSTATQSTSRTATQRTSSTATQSISNTTTQKLIPTEAAKPLEDDKLKLSLPLWAIIVISVAVIVLLILASLSMYCCCRSCRSKQSKKSEKTDEKKETTTKSTELNSNLQEPEVVKKAENVQDTNVFVDNNDIEAAPTYNLKSKSSSPTKHSAYLDMKGV